MGTGGWQGYGSTALLASLHEEQRQRRAIGQALGLPDSAGYGDAITRIVSILAKDAPPCPPAAEVAPEVTVKAKRPRKAKWGGQ